MAGFFKNLMDNAGKATQSAIEKSKELAEITKLNIDSGAAEDSIRQAKQKIGEYVAENNLLNEVPEIHTLLESISNEKARIAENNAKIDAIKAGSTAAGQKAPEESAATEEVPEPAVTEAVQEVPEPAVSEEEPKAPEYVPEEMGVNIAKPASAEQDTDRAAETSGEESPENNKESCIELEKK